MTPRRAPLAPALLAPLLLLAALLAPAVPAAGAQAQVITVTENGARPDFPTGVAFTLVAEAAAPIERVEILYAAGGQRTLNLATPDFVPGRRVEISHNLDLEGGVIPPGVDLAYRWRLVDAAGNETETAPRPLPWIDDRYDWEALTGDRVTVHAYAGDAAFNRTIFETAERTVDRLADAYGIAAVDPVRIWVYASLDDFAGVLRPNSEPWIGGAAYPAYRLIHAVLPTGSIAEVGRVVPHEISHLLLDDATRNPFAGPPTWLDEGLATYHQEVDDQGLPALARRAAAEGRLDSLRVLAGRLPYDADEARLAYAQSLSAVAYILDIYGDDGMARLIAAFRDGITDDEAVQQAFGLSLDELDRRWQASLVAEAAAFPGNDDGGSRGLDTPQAAALASGAPFMALAALLAVVAGTVALVRARRLSVDALEGEG